MKTREVVRLETITKAEIRKKLERHYSGDNSSRDFIACVHNDDHGTPGTVFFSLSGSPPKGWAVLSIGHHTIHYYDVRGKRWQEQPDVKLDETEFEELCK